MQIRIMQPNLHNTSIYNSSATDSESCYTPWPVLTSSFIRGVTDTRETVSMNDEQKDWAKCLFATCFAHDGIW